LLSQSAEPFSIAMAYMIGSILATIYILWAIRGELKNIKWKFSRENFKIIYNFSWPIVIMSFFADLSQIAPTTLYELVRAIDNASTTKNDTLIIDFRGNMGGALDFLPAFFGLFVGKDQFAFDLFHQGERQPNRTTQLKFPEFDRFKEIAILTDNMTQSTAELTTATFKKFHMAKVVGKTTRGWGTIENTYPMDTVIDPEEKFVLLLVNSITLREDGQPIEGLGVSPDVDITKPNWQKELPKYFTSPSLINAIKQVVK
jgi:C-terminal processing protease CtpA/Prc